MKHHNLICVIDDDKALNPAISKLLKGHGYDVLSFHSAEEFLPWFNKEENPCDLIISDINMPGASGYELCIAVREKQTEERIPVILITGNDAEN